MILIGLAGIGTAIGLIGSGISSVVGNRAKNRASRKRRRLQLSNRRLQREGLDDKEEALREKFDLAEQALENSLANRGVDLSTIADFQNELFGRRKARAFNALSRDRERVRLRGNAIEIQDELNRNILRANQISTVGFLAGSGLKAAAPQQQQQQDDLLFRLSSSGLPSQSSSTDFVG